MKSFPRSTYGYVSLLSIALASLAAIPLAAQELDCHPCWHGFGKVPTGSSESFNINLRNSGTQSLNITSDAVQGSEFSVGTFPLPLTLEPGASVQIPLIFTPTTLGGATGRVTLENTGRDSSLMLKLGGTGVNQSSHSVALSWVPGDRTTLDLTSTARPSKAAHIQNSIPHSTGRPLIPTRRLKVE